MNDLNIIGPYLGDPFFYTNWNKGKVELIGKLATHHEVIIKQYIEPFENGLKQFWKDVKDRELTFNIKLTYFNTSGSKHLLNIFNMLDNYQSNKQAKIVVNWFYLKEDIDMIDVVEDYRDLVPLNFRPKPVDDYKYWDNLNVFGDFISEPANFSIVKEIENLQISSRNLNHEKETVIAKAKFIISDFYNKLEFLPEFKDYIIIRVKHLLKDICDAETLNKIFQNS